MVWEAYPLPNATGFVGLIEYANVVTNGWFGNLIPIMIFTIAIFSTGMDKKGFLASSFISCILSLLMLTMGVTNNMVVIAFVIMTIVGVYMIVKEE